MENFKLQFLIFDFFVKYNLLKQNINHITLNSYSICTYFEYKHNIHIQIIFHMIPKSLIKKGFVDIRYIYIYISIHQRVSKNHGLSLRRVLVHMLNINCPSGPRTFLQTIKQCSKCQQMRPQHVKFKIKMAFFV